MKYSKEEIENSKRIYKSATPKQDLSWYVKWIASIILLCAFAFRSTQQFPFIDLCFSLVGVSGWLWVGLLWKDRALVLLNGIAVFILLFNKLSVLLATLFHEYEKKLSVFITRHISIITLTKKIERVFYTELYS